MATRRPALAAASIMAASALATFVLFVVNLAYPTIGVHFADVSPPLLSWVLNGYTVAFAALLVPAGTLADQWGRKRLFVWGLVVFAVGSLLSTVAWDVWTLIIGRILQGAGAAAIVPTSLALIFELYPPAKTKQMIAFWAAAGTIAGAVGPLLGGVLVVWNWRLVFAVNLVFILVALIGATALPSSAKAEPGRLDLVGTVQLVLGIAAAVTAVTYVTQWGVGSALFLSVVGVGVVLLLAFVRRSLTTSAPLVDLRLLLGRSLRSGSLGMALFYGCFTMMLLGGSMFLVQGWQWSPPAAGLGLMIWPASATVVALTISRGALAADRLALIGSGIFLGAALIWLFGLGEPTLLSQIAFFAGAALSGAAAGLAQTGFLAAGTRDLSSSAQATGMSVLNTARQLGSAFGTAALIAVVGAGLSAGGYLAAWLGAAVAAAGALVCAVLLTVKTP